MRRIYGTACHVWCWLPPHKNPQHGPMAAMSLIREIVDRIPNRDIGRAQQSELKTFSEWFTSRLDDPELQQAWDSLLALCSDSYWQRGWVFQEILVARKSWSCLILIGSTSTIFCQWLATQWTMSMLKIGRISDSVRDPAFALQNLAQFVTRLSEWSSTDLLSVLEVTAQSVTSDLQDKIIVC